MRDAFRFSLFFFYLFLVTSIQISHNKTAISWFCHFNLPSQVITNRWNNTPYRMDLSFLANTHCALICCSTEPATSIKQCERRKNLKSENCFDELKICTNKQTNGRTDGLIDGWATNRYRIV